MGLFAHCIDDDISGYGGGAEQELFQFVMGRTQNHKCRLGAGSGLYSAVQKGPRLQRRLAFEIG